MSHLVESARDPLPSIDVSPLITATTAATATADEDEDEDEEADNNVQWQDVQSRTFLNWVNSQLAKLASPPLSNLRKGFVDGVTLCRLLAENLIIAFDFIRSQGLTLTNIGPEDIMDGNLKLILGLVWTLISRFTISTIKYDTAVPNGSRQRSTSEGDAARLLRWCRRQLDSYPSISVDDFSRSWKNGVAFCALIHAYDSSLIDISKISPANERENTILAFDLASKKLNIPRLLEVEDICNVDLPDERSVMMYIAQFVHCFEATGKRCLNRERIDSYFRMISLIDSYLTKRDFETQKGKEKLSNAGLKLHNLMDEVMEKLPTLDVYELQGLQSSLSELLENAKMAFTTSLKLMNHYELLYSIGCAVFGFKNEQCNSPSLKKALEIEYYALQEKISGPMRLLTDFIQKKCEETDFTIQRIAESLQRLSKAHAVIQPVGVLDLDTAVEDDHIFLAKLNGFESQMDQFIRPISSSHIKPVDICAEVVRFIRTEKNLIERREKEFASMNDLLGPNEALRRNHTRSWIKSLADSQGLTEEVFTVTIKALGLLLNEMEAHREFVNLSHAGKTIKEYSLLEQFCDFAYRTYNIPKEVLEAFDAISSDHKSVTFSELQRAGLNDGTIDCISTLVNYHTSSECLERTTGQSPTSDEKSDADERSISETASDGQEYGFLYVQFITDRTAKIFQCNDLGGAKNSR